MASRESTLQDVMDSGAVKSNGFGMASVGTLPAEWVHPELRRIRGEMSLKQPDSASRLAAIQSQHAFAHGRISRVGQLLESKRRELDAITRQRDALSQEIAEEKDRFAKLRRVEEHMADQLAFHRLLPQVIPNAEAQNTENGRPSTAEWLLDDDAAMLRTRDGSASARRRAPALLEPIGFEHLPIARANAAGTLSPTDVIQFLARVAPLAVADDRGRITHLQRVDQPCLVETPLLPCRNARCAFTHVDERSRLCHTIDAVLREVEGCCAVEEDDRQFSCTLQDFVDTVRRKVASASPDSLLDNILIQCLNDVIGAGWVAATSRKVPMSPRGLPLMSNDHRVSPSARDATNDSASTTATRTFFDRVMSKQLGYVVHPRDERPICESIALQYVAAGKPTAEELVRMCMDAFREAPLCICWRIAARFCREHGLHDEAKWLLDTALQLFPCDASAAAERLDVLDALDDSNAESITKITLDTCRLLTNQVNALVLSKQRPAHLTALVKASGYLAAVGAVAAATRDTASARQLLLTFLEPPGVFAATPTAYCNLQILNLVLSCNQASQVAIAERLRTIPLAAINDICLVFSNDLSHNEEWASNVAHPALQRLQTFVESVMAAGAAGKQFEAIRTALLVCRIRCLFASSAAFEATPNTGPIESAVSILTAAACDARSFSADVWAAFLQSANRHVGSSVAEKVVERMELLPAPQTPLVLHLRLMSLLASGHRPPLPDWDARLNSVVAAFLSHCGLDAASLSPQLVMDANVPHRLKIATPSWICFVVLRSAQLDSPRDALALLCALPKSLLTLHSDMAAVVTVEKVALIAAILSATPEHSARETSIFWEMLSDVLRSQLSLLTAQSDSWLSRIDFGAERARTVAGVFADRMHRDLPRIVPPRALHLVSPFRRVLRRVAVECDAW